MVKSQVLREFFKRRAKMQKASVALKVWAFDLALLCQKRVQKAKMPCKMQKYAHKNALKTREKCFFEKKCKKFAKN